MGKNLVATWSMLIKGVRSCQVYYQLLDLYHLKNIKLVFFVKTCLNRGLFMRTICLRQKHSAALSQKNLTNSYYFSFHLLKTY